jgi:hypothetical protein
MEHSTTNESVKAVESTFPELAKKCLGCNSRPDFTFELKLFSLSGELISKRFGCCMTCSEPGSPTYDSLRKRLACLLFMNRNRLWAKQISDSKTAAAGSDE